MNNMFNETQFVQDMLYNYREARMEKKTFLETAREFMEEYECPSENDAIEELLNEDERDVMRATKRSLVDMVRLIDNGGIISFQPDASARAVVEEVFMYEEGDFPSNSIMKYIDYDAVLTGLIAEDKVVKTTKGIHILIGMLDIRVGE